MATSVRYFAGAAAATGVEEETLELHPGTLGELKDFLAQRHSQLEPILKVAAVLVDGESVTDDALSLDAVNCVDVLPPFAGG